MEFEKNISMRKKQSQNQQILEQELSRYNWKDARLNLQIEGL